MFRLMRLAQVHQENHLPPMWTELAATPMTGRTAVVQNCINEQRQALGVYFEVPVTISLVNKLVQLDISGHDSDNVTQGLSPFLFGLTTPQEATQIAYRRTLYQQIHGGAGVPSLADTEALAVPDEVKAATTMQSLQHSIDRSASYFRPSLDNTM